MVALREHPDQGFWSSTPDFVNVLEAHGIDSLATGLSPRPGYSCTSEIFAAVYM